MRHIMIVEDDDDIREVLESVLVEEGFSVTGFAEISGARSALASGLEIPDIILLDFMFPSGNSGEFLTLIRERMKTPVILMSAGNDFIMGENAARAHGFISKPIQIEVLLEEIERVSASLSLVKGR
jgi:DNA-binding NtrC family response regulator